MSELSSSLPSQRAAKTTPWGVPYFQEDLWAIWLGLGLVLLAYGLLVGGSSLKWLAVTPPKWSVPAQLFDHLAANAGRYFAQFALWIVLLGGAAATLGHPFRRFLPGFVFLYVLSLVIFAIGQWDQANKYNLEPPLVALLLGLAIANLTRLPQTFDAAFRVEFYVKLGIVLLGATLPFTLIVWAGPIAILQAGLVSIVTFIVIYATAVWLGLERKFAAVLGAGGSVCGVSAAIAIAAAVRARKQDAPVVITIVIGWAIVMIFVLPLVCRALALPAGVGGAWIGTSEFADAAGLAAAQAYGDLATQGVVPGTADQSVFAFTLMKVLGRDVWIGIWALVLAFIATTRWETTKAGSEIDFSQIWRRFPKFVIGFLLASLAVTFIARGYSLADYNKTLVPSLVGPLKDMRTWAFIFCFFSIGLTTRFRDLAGIGRKPLLAFTAGVAVNLVLGYVLSTIVFASHWSTLAR